MESLLKAPRCGSEWSGILEAAVDPVYFSRTPWAVTTVWLSTRQFGAMSAFLKSKRGVID